MAIAEPASGPVADSRSKGFWIFLAALVGLVLVLIVAVLVIFLWSHRNDDGDSTGFLSVALPIIGTALVGVLGFLGVNRLSHFDEEVDKRVAEGLLRLRGSLDQELTEMRNTLAGVRAAEKAAVETQFRAVESRIAPLTTTAQLLEERFGSTDAAREIVGAIGSIRDARDYFASSYGTGGLSDRNKVNTTNAVIEEVEAKRILGDNSDYHNLATIFARRDFYEGAARVTTVGVDLFPSDLDLISDLIHYRMKIGDSAGIEEAIQRLEDAHPRSRWNWRAFTFVIDALNSLPPTDARMKKTLAVVAEYAEVLPTEERAYFAAHETFERYGEHDRAREALEAAEQKLPMTAQCSLRLAQLAHMEGRHDEAIESASRAIIGQAETQPSSDTGAAFALRAFARDAKLHRALLAGIPITQLEAELRAAWGDYQMAMKLDYVHPNLLSRVSILKFLVGE